jgi:hypothetical protein
VIRIVVNTIKKVEIFYVKIF